ncbi:MAG TPA: twin-arginine translocase TatA/TatE family subunit [Puia sp.]|jgi:sec-independent protein translocase protein TatA|nr:twin-arginine translocase TatA/TatE family subunit [Puia sp.]
MGDLFTGPHIILIALVVLLLFGGKKIPELMRGLGRGIREFKDAKDNVQREIEEHVNDDRKTTSATTNPTTTAAKSVSSDPSVRSN